MQIIVVGCGNVGVMIARALSKEGHNITVIDVNDAPVKAISEELDIMGIVGNGSNIALLSEAGIEGADLLLAVTDSDERNLLCCLIAKKLNRNVNTIARVRNPEYADEVDLIKVDLGLSLSVNPEFIAAREINRLLKTPNATEIDTFANGLVDLLKMEVKEDSPLCGIALKELRKKLDVDVLVCIVERLGETMIPGGDYVFTPGDKFSFIATGKKATQFFKAVKSNQGRAKSTMIIGGGKTSVYLAKLLIQQGTAVKIIEKDPARCSELAEMLPEAVIILGDGGDKNLLLEEGVEHTESFVALANHDEENVMMAVYVKKINPKAKLVTKVKRAIYDDVIADMNIGSIINPKYLSAELIVKYVRAMANKHSNQMKTLYQLGSGSAEAMEFVVNNSPKLIGVPIQQLKLKANVLIACIIHKGEIEAPKGSSIIRAGDTVIVVTTETGFEDINDILA